jgi:hypothetical protein
MTANYTFIIYPYSNWHGYMSDVAGVIYYYWMYKPEKKAQNYNTLQSPPDIDLSYNIEFFRRFFCKTRFNLFCLTFAFE